MARKKKGRESGEFGETPLDELSRMLGDDSIEPEVKKRVRAELHRRRSRGEKVESPGAPAGAEHRAASALEEVKCWMSYHLLGFNGQVLGFAFKGSGGVRALTLMYMLDPLKRASSFFSGDATIKALKSLLASACGSHERYVAVDPTFGLGRFARVAGEVGDGEHAWEGNREQAMDLVKKARELEAGGAGRPSAVLPDPGEEIRRRVARDSTYLRRRDVFHEWVPEEAFLKTLVEKMNLVIGGRISTSEQSKASAVESILLAEADGYFSAERRKIIAASLKENAFVAHAAKERELSGECAALSELVADDAVPSRNIGFLVQCLRGGISLPEAQAGREAPGERAERGPFERTQGGIIIPGRGRTETPAVEEEREQAPGEPLIIDPRSVIGKP